MPDASVVVSDPGEGAPSEPTAATPERVRSAGQAKQAGARQATSRAASHGRSRPQGGQAGARHRDAHDEQPEARDTPIRETAATAEGRSAGRCSASSGANSTSGRDTASPVERSSRDVMLNIRVPCVQKVVRNAPRACQLSADSTGLALWDERTPLISWPWTSVRGVRVEKAKRLVLAVTTDAKKAQEAEEIVLGTAHAEQLRPHIVSVPKRTCLRAALTAVHRGRRRDESLSWRRACLRATPQRASDQTI